MIPHTSMRDEIIFRSLHPAENIKSLDIFTKTKTHFRLERRDRDFSSIKLLPLSSV